jgi:hypothetical protein
MLDSDWPVYFLLSLEYTEEWGDDAVKQYGKYHLTISAVAPEAVGEQEMVSARRSMGAEGIELDPQWLAVMLADYGVKAQLWQKSGNNAKTLLQAARKEFGSIRIFFGFYMDRPQNAIGSTGWDFVRGDSLAALAR